MAAEMPAAAGLAGIGLAGAVAFAPLAHHHAGGLPVIGETLFPVAAGGALDRLDPGLVAEAVGFLADHPGEAAAQDLQIADVGFHASPRRTSRVTSAATSRRRTSATKEGSSVPLIGL